MRSQKNTVSLDTLPPGPIRGGGTLLCGDTAEAVQTHVLRQAQDAVARGEACIYVSALTPQALAERAAPLGFDVGEASRAGTFRLLPPPSTLFSEASDEARTQALADLTTVVRRRRPAHLIVEDAAPLTRFDTDDWFDAAFAAMHNRLAEVGTTLTLGLPDAADDHARERLRTHVMQIVAVPNHEPSASQGDGASYQVHPMLDPQATPLPLAAPAPTPVALPTGIDYLDLTIVLASPRPTQDDFAEPAPFSLGRGHYVAADSTLPAPPLPALRQGDTLDRALLGGTTVEARSDLDSETLLIPPDADLFETVDVQRTLRAFEGRPEPTKPAPLDHAPPPSPRLAFVQAFNAALDAHAADETPFIALALRMPLHHPASRRFHFVISGFHQFVGAKGVVLADEARRRVVVMLPGRTAEAAQALIRQVKAHLRASTAEADHALQNVTALVVLNGKPFPNATEFLAHVFD